MLRQSKGQFNPQQLYFGSHQPQHVEYASYTGPLTVKLIAGQGCGLVLTAAARKGQLLAVCKPLAVGESKHAGMVFDHSTGCMNDMSQADLITQLISLCSSNSTTQQRVYALYDHADNACRHEEDATFLQGVSTGNMTPQRLSVDSAKVARLVKYNAFGEGKSHNATPMDPLVMAKHETSARHCMCALYPLLSMANHSCCPNSQYMLINDVAFVRAGKDLKKGEEVTISYQGNQLQAHVQERQKATQNWGFHCKCARCQAEMSIPSGVNKALQTIRANLSSSPCAPGSVLASFRAANKSSSTRDYAKVVQQVQLLLNELDAALAETVLSDQQKGWMCFTVLSAYECCRTCYEHLQDFQALHQVWQTILRLHKSTSPASDYHVREAVTAVYSLHATCGGTHQHLVRNAIKQAEAVMALRYGPMSDAQMQQAVQQVADRATDLQQRQ
ncbi:TPA: hypothetical protein ACH3X2_000420 [Trebouxia sp. C0005]